MPIKPIYAKPPMAVLHAVPLGPGQVKSQNAELVNLYKLVKENHRTVEMWEGSFRLACIVTENPMEEPIARVIRDALKKQAESGSLDGTLQQSIALMRATLAMYEYSNDRQLLRRVALWCGYLSSNWDEIIQQTYLRTHAADLMEILEKVYRYTGKVALLSLCDRLRMASLNWSSILHTFGVKRPMNQIASWLEMRAGMDREKDQETGLYTRQYLTGHAETLADGMRAAYLNSLYSGSRDESTAGLEGWQKIYRWHGLPCGGTSADEALEGNNPSCAMDAASLGAWAEALSLQMMSDSSTWAMEAVDIIAHNSLPATIMNGLLVPYQRPNCLVRDASTRDCYKVHQTTEQRSRCYARMTRAWAQIMSSSIMTTSQGCSVNLYFDGDYTMMLDEQPCRVSMRTEGLNRVHLRFQSKGEIHAHVDLHIFSWMRDVTLKQDNQPIEARMDGEFLRVNAEIQPGDEWVLSWENEIRLTEEFHQGVAVYLGDRLMVLPVKQEENWMLAMQGKPEMHDGKLIAIMQEVEGWGEAVGVPGLLPILPEKKTETVEKELAMYATCPIRIAVFPKVNRA